MGAYQCVNAIKEGCELYKQTKESFVEIKESYDEVAGDVEEIKGIVTFLITFFREKLLGKPVVVTPKPKVKSKQKSKYVTVDETKVRAGVIANLTEFLTIQEKMASIIREMEYKSSHVYDKDQNHMKAALERVDALDQMAALEVTIRETMVYQSPPEMGALYSKVFEMRDIIREEQEQARLAEEQQERAKLWQLRQQETKRKITIYLVIATLFLAGYLHLWLLYLSM